MTRQRMEILPLENALDVYPECRSFIDEFELQFVKTVVILEISESGTGERQYIGITSTGRLMTNFLDSDTTLLEAITDYFELTPLQYVSIR